MMRVLLVDDEPLALKRLAVAFRDMADTELVGTACDGVEALERITELRPDLVILDVQMPGLTGIAVAKALEAVERRPDVVFVTAFEHFAAEAFGVDATDYLLKPVHFDRLRLAIDRARRRRSLRDANERAAELETVVAALRAEARLRPAPILPAYDTAIWVPGRNGAVRVAVDRIDWIEAAKDYVLLNTSLKSHILRATMADLEKRLDPAIMLRIHRSYFVRIAAVATVERPGRGVMRLRLEDGADLKVGPNYIENVGQVLKL